MSDLYISWTEYHQKIETLAQKIYHSQWQFNQIVCLARGGLRVGDILSRIFDQPLAILSTSSYSGVGGKVRGGIKLAEHLTMTTDTLGSQVLLVDDLVDSGVSLQESIGWLKSRYPQIQEMKTAVLWYKSCSAIAPDYYIDYLEDNPWIHQPFECYEKQINPTLDLIGE
ncbi:MAG TPA: phosphoribosyltransferase [Candidatus Obscuribacterales bacterium]